jgi:thiamine biosynthesis protein ThiS
MLMLNLNGEDRRFGAPLTVAELIRKLEIKAVAVAVEVNRAIVPRSQHESHLLKDGDQVEIVTFVGGG